MLKKGVLVVLCIVLSAGLLMAGEKGEKAKSTDYGKQPWVVDIEDLTEKNEQFRATKWTGQHLQLTVMTTELPSTTSRGVQQPRRMNSTNRRLL